MIKIADLIWVIAFFLIWKKSEESHDIKKNVEGKYNTLYNTSPELAMI